MEEAGLALWFLAKPAGSKENKSLVWAVTHLVGGEDFPVWTSQFLHAQLQSQIGLGHR